MANVKIYKRHFFHFFYFRYGMTYTHDCNTHTHTHSHRDGHRNGQAHSYRRNLADLLTNCAAKVTSRAACDQRSGEDRSLLICWISVSREETENVSDSRTDVNIIIISLFELQSSSRVKY